MPTVEYRSTQDEVITKGRPDGTNATLQWRIQCGTGFGGLSPPPPANSKIRSTVHLRWSNIHLAPPPVARYMYPN